MFTSQQEQELNFTPGGVNAVDAASVSSFASPRGKVLTEAKMLTEGVRNADYGDPKPEFERLAKLIGAYLNVEITATDAAVLMCLLKINRLRNNPAHWDSAVDLAAYAAIAAECALSGT